MIRDLVKWRADRLGLGPVIDSKAWPDHDEDLFLSLIDRTQAALPRRQRRPIEVVTDSETVGAALGHLLNSAGYETKLVMQSGIQRFQMHTAGFLDDADGLDASELRVMVRRFLADAGLASAGHPLLQQPEPADAVLPRVELPATALREGRLRPWVGDSPQRFRVRLHTDDESRIAPLVSALQRAGFGKVEVLARSRPETAPLVALRCLRTLPGARAGATAPAGRGRLA